MNVRTKKALAAIFFLAIFWLGCRQEGNQSRAIVQEQEQEAPYQMIDTSGKKIETRFLPPKGFERIPVVKGSFGEHLRNTYLRPADAQVYFYNGKVKYLRNVYSAVIDWDITSNAMTSVDCVTWFHSEYCYKKGLYEHIVYPLHNGFMMDFTKWIEGYRTTMEDNNFRWEKTAEPDSSYFQLRNFQDYTFAYADAKSAKFQAEPSSPELLDFGTVFISEDRWGHGVIVVDVAEHPDTRERVFMLAQSFVPAQEMQILQNPVRSELSPWYSVQDIDSILITPEWTFTNQECFKLRGL